MNSGQYTTVLVSGLVCVVAAIVGGGVTAAGWQFPIVNSLRRQLLLGVFGGALIALAVFAHAEPDTHTLSKAAASNPTVNQRERPSRDDEFRDSLFLIIDAASDRFESIRDPNNNLLRMLPGALRGRMGKDWKGWVAGNPAKGSLWLYFAFYDFGIGDTRTQTFEDLVAKVRHAVGDEWAEAETNAKRPMQQRIHRFTSPGQRTEVGVFEQGLDGQQPYTLEVWVKDLKAELVAEK